MLFSMTDRSNPARPPRQAGAATQLPPIRRPVQSWQVHALQAAVGLIGCLFLAAGAQVTLPVGTVPATLQSFVLVVLGLLGRRLVLVSVLMYLAAALLGLPVLADGRSAAGLAFFQSPGAGFLLGFVPAAILVGWLRDRATAKGLVGWLLLAFAAHVVLMLCGSAWILVHSGAAAAAAILTGPLWIGAVMKSVLAAMIATVRTRRRPLP
jgi:biotin transport system substrate-specific component